MEILNIIIVGGGPCGIAAAIEAKRADLSYIVLEKGSITESIRRYPVQMTFFSTSDNLSIAGIPFPTIGPKPTRAEALEYYRKVAEYFKVEIKLYTEVTAISKTDGIFYISTATGEEFRGRNVIMATGYFDVPRKLGIPGEELPHVQHYYDEPYAYVHRNVVIAGGGNSAVETALQLYHHKVDVTMVLRKKDFKPTAKYWLIPDLKNRIKEGAIKVIFEHEIKEIRDKEVLLTDLQNQEDKLLPADFVLLLIGYLPDVELLSNAGVEVAQGTCVPSFNTETFETNVRGLYLAGTVICGISTENVFIENGRHHGKAIVEHIIK